jgi:PLP dependent protein
MSEKEVNITIANRLATAHDNIAKAAQNSNRSKSDIKLMAVSKTKSIQEIRAAYDLGQKTFGENYAQELAEKKLALNDLKDLEWHFIGPIQSNKTALIADVATWVDSVDRIKIARRLDTHAAELNKTLNVLIQVNISDSTTKSGVNLKDVYQFALEMRNYSSLTLRGLMAIPDENQSKEQLIHQFKQMQACYSGLQDQYDSIDTLSLGMSGDVAEAISCGSNLVRLGTAIFGPRQ